MWPSSPQEYQERVSVVTELRGPQELLPGRTYQELLVYLESVTSSLYVLTKTHHFTFTKKSHNRSRYADILGT